MPDQRPCRTERGWRKRAIALSSEVAPTDALANLQAIRDTLERTAQFTALPGRGIMLIGATALVACWMAARYSHSLPRWVLVWLCEAVLAFSIALISGYRKSARLGLPLWSGAGRRMIVALGPPLFAGAVLTLAGFMLGAESRLAVFVPGMWLLLYGAALMAAGAHSVAPVPVMGASFLMLGAVVLLINAPWVMNLAMALGFGGLHLGFGWYIARRHGG